MPEEIPSESKPENEIIELLPKAYRSRAKVILHYLLPNLKQDQNKHIIFPDGTIGSHILDYLRYFLNPLKAKPPVEANKFANLLEKSGVPQSVYSRHVFAGFSWLTF